MSTNGNQVVSPPEAVELPPTVPGRVVAAGAGWDWVVTGWSLFARAPLMWIIAIVVLVVLAIFVNVIPILGTLAFQLMQPVFTAGFVVGCRSLEKGGEFEIEHLVAGFSKHFVPLLVVGAITMLGWLAILLVFMAFVGMSLLGALLTGDANMVANAIATSLVGMLIGTLICLALVVPLMAAYWFAPALVMLSGMAPLEAMKASLFACFRNFIPFLVYSIVMLLALIVAMIPFGLGLLVWIPVAIASTYAAYRAIFTDPAA